MQTSVDIGRIGLWQGVLDQQPSSRVREIAAEIEAMGWGALWIPESTGRDALVSSSVLLGATTTLKVATGIAQIHARDPIAMANGQRTLAEAYGERFLLGLGVSHAPLIEGVRKQAYVKPYSLMKAYLAAMAGAMFTAVGPPSPPPTVLAALGPKMLELSRDAAQGAHPYFVPPEHTVLARSVLGPQPLLAVEQMVILDTDPATARALARQDMVRYLRLPNYVNNLRRLGYGEDDLGAGAGTPDGNPDPSDRLVDAIVAWGDEDAVKARVQAHLDAGADHVCVQHLVADRTRPPLEQWRRLAEVLL
ncbi:MAG: LLM class F420-dependent oxidoreductase [Acidimicrobiales bacterium]|nr:LLM class F420-dependent oxidoreductase [Acidimicrobiales bacterium]